MVVGAWYVRALAVAGGLAALVPTLAMWGFTVDDALIPLRYAHHLATGVGYRFNADGLSTDGVTPLPWSPLLAPLSAGDDLLVALVRVKAIGAAAWTIAGAMLGRAIASRANGGRRGFALAASAIAAIALSFPIGAWAASGMETGIATALATCAAVSFARPRLAAILAGMAATLRPELVVWAAVLASGAGIAALGRGGERGALRVSGTVVLAVAPFLVNTLLRLALFGRPAPLAVLAKPSDLAHGGTYAFAAAVVLVTPILAFAPLALRRASALGRTIAIAGLAHVLVVVAVGGDWMPYARLLVPIAPSLALAFVEAGQVARVWSSFARGVAALAMGVVVLVRAAPAGRGVHEARADLVRRARPALVNARVVAALDVGWVGASTEARIVDLAGLTDPAIAVLHGGHTSKAVDMAMLLERNVDAIVVYGEPRVVELRLLRSVLFTERFERTATIPFGSGQRYDVYRLR
jgi:hypothetical protein